MIYFNAAFAPSQRYYQYRCALINNFEGVYVSTSTFFVFYVLIFRCASISRISYDHHSLRPSLTHSLRHTSHLTQPILLDIALSTWPNYSHLTLPFPRDLASLTWHYPSHLTYQFLLNINLPTWPSYSHLTLPLPLDTKCYFDIALPSWYYNANLTLPFPLATIVSPSHLKLSISPNLTIFTWPSCSHLTLPFPFDLAILTCIALPTWPSYSHLHCPSHLT